MVGTKLPSTAPGFIETCGALRLWERDVHP